MNYGKIAVSALFSASLLAFGSADAVLNITPVAEAYAADADCRLRDCMDALSRRPIPYTITSLDYGTGEPGNTDESEFVNTFMYDSRFTLCRPWEQPDGQYVVLDFTGEGVRFDFFMGKDGNYFRQVTEDGGETLFHAEIDGDESAGELVSRWCRQLTQSGGPSALVVTSNFVGRWAETNAHRGIITVTKNGGEYDVEIDWSNGAAEHDIWRMTATPSGSDRFSYSDGEYSVRKYRPDGNYNETVRSTGLTGTFILHGSETLVWSDDEQGRDSVFVRI